jgi:hypothetical protein
MAYDHFLHICVLVESLIDVDDGKAGAGACDLNEWWFGNPYWPNGNGELG